MGVALRQSGLFVAEDWRVIYRAFTEVNFAAYDFDTIRAALVDYIRINFPEDFNDWIESSEFVALIELLAYLGQSLTFRVDLNTRENFLDTAERRESVLRLARMLSFIPSRNRAAAGLVKLTQISTTQSLTDSNGNDLSNISVRWNDANNPDWFEQFILILNAVFSETNPFGRPLKEGLVNRIKTQTYSLNNDPSANRVFPFSSTINGENFDFEIVNPDFEDNGLFFERSPNPIEPLHLIFRTDGRGNASPNTGFFLLFKQGVLQKEDFRIDIPIENRILNLLGTSVNNDDVFVQEIDEQGFIVQEWTKVPAIVGNNVIFNSLEKSERDIFNVVTRPNDQISIRFADGRFANVPTGLFRIWYRESAGVRFTIKPENMRNNRLDIPYFDGVNNDTFFVSFTFSLQESVSNSTPSETSASVKERAPQVFFTQDRMVNGEDYNVFPLRNPEAARIKAVNRIHSGFSRHIDINDPTGFAQNVNLFAEDGLLYFNFNSTLEELALPANISDDEIVSQIIAPLVRALDRKHFFYFHYPRFTTEVAGQFNESVPATHVFWFNATNAVNTSTGRFFVDPDGGGPGPLVPIAIGDAVSPSNPEFHMNEGGLVLFNNAGWVSIVDVVGDGDTILENGDGAVRLAEPIDDGDFVRLIIPPFKTEFDDLEILAIQSQIVQKNSFGLRYNEVATAWRVITGDNLDTTSPFSFEFAGDLTGLGRDASWLIRAEFSPTNWRFISRGLDYVFESTDEVRFHHSEATKIVDTQTGLTIQDFIRVLKVNPAFATVVVGTSTGPYVNGQTIIINFNEVSLSTGTTVDDAVIDINAENIDGITASNEGGFLKIVSENALTLEEGTGTALADLGLDNITDIDFQEINPCFGIGENIDWNIEDVFVEDDGFVDPRRLKLTFTDTDEDGIPDDPTIFEEITKVTGLAAGDTVSLTLPDEQVDETELFWESFINIDGFEEFRPTETVVKAFNIEPLNFITTVFPTTIVLTLDPAELFDGDVVFFRDTGNFYRSTIPTVGDDEFELVNDLYFIRRGRDDLLFQWKHFAPTDQRIDPAITNIIDIFVLTTSYDIEIRQWIDDDGDRDELPIPSTNEQLQILFAEEIENKMISDEIVWHPVKYKILFGRQAEDQLQARFKVTKVEGTTSSDGEIKAGVIGAINEFFAINNFDFGETFYFTELAAFIHQSLATIIGSVVIVPLDEEQKFGELFQVRSAADEVFISSAKVADVQIVNAFNDSILRIGD
ncbi:hypothetical protein LCGC14_0554310 [marine sediment metagenome]|uniref:Baseplate protein J-like domain-containing protein n=1 Tax=marine sediment metagenome TaxID=412755 RepID=A0A0F9UA99_9ZZZZ